MDYVLATAAVAVLGYLIGAIPFGYLVARARGVDIFQHGSGNIGATNVGRVLGWRFGILAFVLDLAKGALPTLAGLGLATAWDIEPRVLLAVAAGLAAFAGHLFPIYLRFRGGKGVATGAGIVLVLLPLPALLALLTWVLIVAVFRYVSLASLTAAVMLLAVFLATTPLPPAGDQVILGLFCLIAFTLVFVKHRSNLLRLLHGTENRLPDGPTMRTLSKTVHVLAVGLWFGMAVFFSFPVALSLFSTFETEAQQNSRPSWFPLPPDYRLEPGLQKDQGTRAAGFAISPLFDHYFLWQGICGLLATVTALGWARAEPGRRVHGVRVVVLLLAVTTVILGWPLERQVGALRHARNEASDNLMQQLKWSAAAPGDPAATSAVAQAREASAAVRKDFGTWHLWSLLLNMVTIVLVAVAMALTAQLPGATQHVANKRQAAPREAVESHSPE
jgi:acyl phosphate:glycerol-3-phosphate acyltransferase